MTNSSEYMAFYLPILTHNLLNHLPYFLFFLLLSGFWLVIPNHARAQRLSTSGSVAAETMGSNGDRQPFYFWTNQLGHVNTFYPYHLFTHIVAESQWKFNKNDRALFAGVNANFRKAGVVKFNLPEAYLGYRNRIAQVTTGLFADSVRLGGLSSTYGNFLVGQNSRPYPRVRLGTNRFVKLGKGNFAIAAFYEEGVLNDSRVVKNAMLHHKNLFFRHGSVERLEFTRGIEHFTFWSGRAPSGVNYPQKPADYLRAVLSLPGSDEDAIGRKNVVGNQLGQYIFTFRKRFERVDATAQVAHMFEDFSGMAFVNYPDNMVTLSLGFREGRFLKQILGEYTHTRHQSGDDIDNETGEYKHLNGRDGYLGHSEYNSGFIYDGQWMGSPLFGPVRMVNGIARGPENNRFYAVHLGGRGNLHPQLGWTAKATWSRNFGRYGLPYKPTRDQMYSIFMLQYTMKQLPFSIDAAFAFDDGWLWEVSRSRQKGVSLQAAYRF